MHTHRQTIARGLLLAFTVISGLLGAAAILRLAGHPAMEAQAAVIPPPEGYPKFILSTKTVTPTLAPSGGVTLTYEIEIVNTGAYTGYGVTMFDAIPTHTVYNNDAEASDSTPLVYTDGVLTWSGAVGFDSSVVIKFSVGVITDFTGIVSNTAVISHAVMAEPMQVSAETFVTDDPFFEIVKTSSPEIPGPGKLLTYTLTVTNRGQEATSLPVTVTDELPANTTFESAGQGGTSDGQKVTWTPELSLKTGESTQFVFTVQIGDVTSGQVIRNEHYQIEDDLGGLSVGQVYSVTVSDPLLFIYKETDPFPPGANREMTYTLTIFNKGSLATDLVISDTVPDGVEYVRGGDTWDVQSRTVSWLLDSLETGESATFQYTVYVGDIAEVPVLNQSYQVCSTGEGVCTSGRPMTSIVKGPTFEVTADLDPIAKKPGGGSETTPVTPTLTVKNLGPGNALNANVLMYFRRISVSLNDMTSIPDFPAVPKIKNGPDCGDKCSAYSWVGNLDVGEMITFTTTEGQSTIGGAEGTHYTATVIVTDTLGGFVTEPISATAIGKVTHFANLIPEKSAPPVIGAGQLMTYTIVVGNSGLSTDVPPFPLLTDTVPFSLTVVRVSDGGISFTIGESTVVSWTLPALSTGDSLTRSYSVRVADNLVSGTLIVNDDYKTSWFDSGGGITGTFSIVGEPITTVVKETGLIDSFKVVTPTLALPGPSNLLTYVVHVVNSGPVQLSGVTLHDLLPWQVSTYQRDATISSGQVISDIVSVDWTGDVEAYSKKLITFTVLVDPYYEGLVTNTVIISQPDLITDVIRTAVAYITDDPVLRISKTASPSPVPYSHPLLYTIRVENLGQQATELVVTDTLPINSNFVPFSASGSSGQLVGRVVWWELPVIGAGEYKEVTFSVTPKYGSEIVNDHYRVSSAEGASDWGDPVVTKVIGGGLVFLPLVFR